MYYRLFLGRHDEPEEQEQDRIRAEIRASHRFDSFAGERSQNTVKWYAHALSFDIQGPTYLV
jgi:phospholipase D1/2